MPRHQRKCIRGVGNIEFQMTPMIDVVFLLLIFFICTTQFPEFEGKFDIQLPDPGQVAQAAAMADVPEDIIVHVARNGELLVNGSARTPAELGGLLSLLAEMNPKQAVIIEGEPDAIHQYVVHVLNACYRAGVSNISFAALREE